LLGGDEREQRSQEEECKRLDLDRTTIIAGLKIKVIRDAVRQMARLDTNDGGWTITSLANHMGISPTHAEWLSEILVEQKILERKPPPSWEKHPSCEARYTLGEYGTRFTLARMLKRIDRAKVDKIIGDLLKRVTQINADLELCYFVNEIRLFGSAMDSDAESFGDVDIAYDLGRRKRPPEYDDWHDWSHQRWKLAGRRNLDFIQALYYAEHEVLRRLEGRNQYLSMHNFDDVVGIGADSIRLFILPEGQIESEDGESGEKLHQTRIAGAKERAENKERRATEKLVGPAALVGREQSHEQIKQQMITAAKSLAFDLIRAIDESSPSEVLERSITVTQQRIAAYRTLKAPYLIPDILRDALSVDVVERFAPEGFVFSEERERNARDGTDKQALAHKQVTHAVLGRLKKRVLGESPLGYDESYNEIEHCFRLWREAQIDRYQYQIAHPHRWYTYELELSETALATLRNIANHANERLHQQGLKRLSDRGFIKPLRKKWRLTPDGERALEYQDAVTRICCII
jgi:hypothetical protein